MSTARTYRAAQRLAARKGLTLRKMRGKAVYTLGYSRPVALAGRPMIFETVQDALAEIRMH